MEQDDSIDKGDESPEHSERVQKRINKEVWRRNEAERRFKAAEQRNADLEKRLQEIEKRTAPKPPEKPKIEDFDTDEEFYEALTGWTLTQQLSERDKKQKEAQQQEAQKAEQASKQEQWNAKGQELAKKYDDYHEAIDELTSKLPKTPSVGRTIHQILQREDGPELLYGLAKNPEKAVQVFPELVTSRLDQIAESLRAPKQSKTNLPNPPKPITGGASTKSDVNKSGRELPPLIVTGKPARPSLDF